MDMSEATNQKSDSAIMLQLTAYLDGELENDEIHLVEERLATDAKYRSLMQELQRTWDVLDILPAASASAGFTQSTMKMVVEDAHKLTSRRKRSVWSWPLRALALLLVPSLATLIAFCSFRYVQDSPNRQLKQDFIVIRDFDALSRDRNLSIELLQALVDNPRVLGNRSPVPGEARFSAYKYDDVKLASLENQTSVVKERVRMNRVGFLGIEPDDQARLRALAVSIDESEQRVALRKALYDYDQWLQGLGETDYSTVLDSPTAEKKLATMKLIVDDRYLRDFAVLMPKEDLKSIYLALTYLYARPNQDLEKKFVQLFGTQEEAEIQVQASAYQALDRGLFLGGARLKKIYHESPESIDQVIFAEDVDWITKKLLSENGKFFFENANVHSASVKSEAHLLASWMVTAYDEKFSPKEHDLQDFFESLPSDDQDSLNNEFPEDRHKRLLKMWEATFN